MNYAGSMVWPSAAEPIWRLKWRLSTDPEGVVITDAFFRGRRVFWKASLPSLRVQYDQVCGPYKDPLTSNNMQPSSRCPGAPVCVYSYQSQGLRALGVESYHKIGWYRLIHRWVFWEDGVIMPRLYSAGLQCDGNHRHHAYWRLDFDLDGFPNDLSFEFNQGGPNVGWGPGWSPIPTETSHIKNPPTGRTWAIMDKGTGLGYHIIPGPFDGFADAFSRRDLWVTRYHGAEDRSGNQGSPSDDAIDADLNEESTDGQDIVLWYCGHLFHEHAAGGDEWHHVGPDLAPFGPW